MSFHFNLKHSLQHFFLYGSAGNGPPSQPQLSSLLSLWSLLRGWSCTTGRGVGGHVHSCMGWSTGCNSPIADRNQGCFSLAHLQETQQPLLQFSTLSILLWAQASHKWSPRSLYPLSVLPPVQLAKSIHLLCFKLQGWGTQNMTPTTHFQRGSPPT